MQPLRSARRRRREDTTHGGQRRQRGLVRSTSECSLVRDRPMNARTITLVIALAGAAAGPTGCASTRTTGSQIQDMRISGRVQRRMVLKPDVRRYAIDVDTLDHVV